ncbi:efflux RND transporter periplasmic adaptor subunit [Pseudoalteromonas ulvae]|uniref:Efflux transporter periplasmic adaptor subunit n=1 Tax=Pseudoalteromonas ulvae TaxID=107327 RepID=A0A2C9ZZL8_PSEDV|nr:efflux RND transporter periplasmic adaptor subunit [Pseudoalteromonas ulvae]OUL56206.1 efflux transporter periplasmic adaptor subunit [Pseudoalteromonas ulvae]
MNNKWMKGLLPLVVLGVAIGVFSGINATANEKEDSKAVDKRPTVKIEALAASDHQVVITSYGEVRPLERTQLSAQVSGEIINWHPEFVAGGLVKRGEILFSIEPDNYQAQVYSAQAELARAQAALIEEQAAGEVARKEAKRSPNLTHSDLYLRKPQILSAQAAVKSAEANLKRAERDLENCQVRAPFDALVIGRELGLGQFVNTGAQVAVLNNIETAEVLIPIAGFDSAFLPRQIKGIKATVSQKGLANITREAFIARDLGIIDSATRMSNLVVRIEDPYGLTSDVPPLKFGSYVEVNFAGQTLNQIFRLPQELVNNSTVWIVNDEQKLQPKQVQVLREEGEYFLINAGLDSQDKLVLTLPEYPQKGMEVKVANAEVTATTNTDNL